MDLLGDCWGVIIGYCKGPKHPSRQYMYRADLKNLYTVSLCGKKMKSFGLVITQKSEYNNIYKNASTLSLKYFAGISKQWNHSNLVVEGTTPGHYGMSEHSLIRGVLIQSCAPPELKISPIMNFVIHNSVVLSKILEIVVPF